MRTDAIYYQLFKRFPSLLFTLLDHPPERVGEYRFESIEVKETAFRIDGVFLPPEAASPRIVYLAEVQFQKDEALYHRFFSELFVYLFRNQNSFDNWFGVLIFRSRSLEPTNPAMHLAMLNSPQVQRIYLDELGEQPHPSIGIRLMQLTLATEENAAAQARRLIEAVHQENTGLFSKQAIMDMVTTISVYKFAGLSRLRWKL